MIAEVTAAIGIGSACFVNSSASDWSSTKSCIAISVATIVVYRADLSNIRARVSNGA